MGAGAILRVSWLCLLLLGDGLAFPLMKGDGNPSQSGQLETSPTEMLGAYDQATAYADRSYETPLAAAQKQPLLSPADVSYEPSTTRSLKPGSLVFPSSELSFDPIPPHQSFNFEDSSPVTQTFAAEPVYSSGDDFDPSQNLYLHGGVQEGSQGTSPNLVYDIPYLSAEEADYPFKGGDSSNHYSVVPVLPRTWFSASYVTREEEPVFTSDSGYWDHAVPTSTGMQTPEAKVPSSGGKGGDFSYSQNFNFQAGDDGSQDPSHDFVYEEVFQYPSAETASKGGDPSSYNYAAAWSSAAHGESAASPSYLSVDSTSGKVSAAPVRRRPVRKVPARLPGTQRLDAPQEVSVPFLPTYVTQSEGGYSRGRKVSSKTKYVSGFPPPPPFVYEALRRASDNKRKG